MATIGVSGLISGLDTESIISQMMQLERRPITLLQRQEASYQAKISGVGTLKSVLSALQTATSALGETDLFDGFKASSGNTDVATVSADETAVAGTYQLEVTSLATSQSVRSNAFAASDTAIGTGTLSIQLGSNDAVEVSIDSNNNTLAGIATAINDADTDVTAGVINDGAGNYYLTLTGKETGAANTITFTVTTDDDGNDSDAAGLSDLYVDPVAHTTTETMTAADADLWINNMNVSRESNTIDDLIEGVTLTLNDADPGNPFDITVSRNVSSITTKINDFVSKYNDVVDALASLQASDPDSGNVGLLQGDSTPRLVQTQLRSLLYAEVDGVDGAVNGLSYLGIEADDDGKLSFDSSSFASAYASNREDVVNFFTQTTSGSEGWSSQFDEVLDGYLDSYSGILTSKENSLNSSIDRIGDQVERIEFRLDKREANLRHQFEALESLLAQFQSTSGQLSQQLESISNLNAQISKK